jgi:hypothetical protein
MAFGLSLVVLLVLGLVTVGVIAAGLALNRGHRRDDAARSSDRVNGP